MAAEIKPMSIGSGSVSGQLKSLTMEKPILLSKIDNSDEIFGVQILSEGKSILSISNDK